MVGKRLAEFMATYSKYVEDPYVEGGREFFRTLEIELAKAFMLDFPDSSVKVAKIILAMNGIEDVKVKIE